MYAIQIEPKKLFLSHDEEPLPESSSILLKPKLNPRFNSDHQIYVAKSEARKNQFYEDNMEISPPLRTKVLKELQLSHIVLNDLEQKATLRTEQIKSQKARRKYDMGSWSMQITTLLLALVGMIINAQVKNLVGQVKNESTP